MSRANDLLRRLNDFREHRWGGGDQETWERLWMEVREYLADTPQPDTPQPDSVHFSVEHPDGSLTDYGLRPSAAPAKDERRQVMPKIGGKRFRCDCGCSVFTEHAPLHYECNGCGSLWTGER